jgi:diguanylate cyclase (GGDEF)-like protein/PAS domain S-box-containing protein
LLGHLHEGACLVDRAPRISYWSASAEQITGYVSGEVLGRPCAHKLLHLENEARQELCTQERCPVLEAMEDGEARELHVHLRRRDGERILARLRIVPILDDRGRAAGVVELFTDRSAHETSRVRIAELQRALLVDPVTELANRRYADLQLEARLSERARFGWPFGLVFFDIDDFKAVNDRYGHNVGDRVLARVARTASRCVRSVDTVCRWGGDEFVALVSHVDSTQLGRVAEKIRALVAGSPVRVGSQELPVTVSVGAALAGPEETSEDLLARADELMYLSKAHGGNRVSLADAGQPAPRPPEALRPQERGSIHVLLADDHQVVREGLAALLKDARDVRVVGEAANGAEAVELTERLAPDVVLMDVNMPVMDGVEATRLIVERHPQVRVIGLSALSETELVRTMTGAGASVFVSKAASPRELLRAIRDVVARP